jgi:parvulin-like peptidyl-prolyl isomerase
VPELGQADAQVTGAIDSMKAGEVSQVMQSGNKLLVAVVTAVNPPHPATLSEVEAAVRTNYIQVRAVDLAKQNAAEAAALLKKNNDIKAAAKAVDGEVKSTDFFAEKGAAEGIGSASVFGDLFSKPVGTMFGPLTTNNQTYVGLVTARQDADMAKFAQEREQIVLQLKSRKAQERQSLLQDSVLAELIKQGKVKKHQQVIDRLIAQYRS